MFFSRLHPRFYVLACLLVVLVSGISLVSAQELVSGDLRINQVAHFGGDALYCVDTDFVATTSYPETTTDGGFRLLNSEGQELWFVPAEVINAAVAEARTSGKGVLVAEGRGSFGPVALYTYVIDDVEHFAFAGYDEFGKPNSLDFTFCTPVGPDPQAPRTATEEPCVPFNKLVPNAEIEANPCCPDYKLSGPGKLIHGFSFYPCPVPTPTPPPCKVLAAPSLFYRATALLNDYSC
jgi:hypothetical protein